MSSAAGNTRFAIVGGGISGLAAAHRLAELCRERGVGARITLLEAEERLGGVIATTRRGDFLLEAGPDAFITDKPWALELCRGLGVDDELVETRASHRRSFVVRDGRLVPMPEGWQLLAPTRWSALWGAKLLSWPGKVRMACEPWIPARRGEDDESVAAFVRRRFGQEALERVGQPVVGGIYTADPEALSLQATLPRWREMERRFGSVGKGLRMQAAEHDGAARTASGPRYSLFLSMRRGMASLVEALAASMPAVAIRRGVPVLRLEPKGAVWALGVPGGETIEAEAVCLALPADRAAALVKPFASSLARELSAIEYESVATVNLAYEDAELPPRLRGFGFVVPAIERRPLVGCSFSSLKFPGRAPQRGLLLRAFVGGATHRGLLAFDDEALVAMVREQLGELIGLDAAPASTMVARFVHAMPQYRVGHAERVAAIERALDAHPGLSLTGNGYRGIGIPDCIHQAHAAAERMVDRATNAP